MARVNGLVFGFQQRLFLGIILYSLISLNTEGISAAFF
jgi:hypothetical protein